MHSAHQMAPFEVMYGYHPDFTIPPGPSTKFLALNSQLQTLHEICKKTEAALRMEKHTMKEAFELDKPPPHTFVPGQKVCVKDLSPSKRAVRSHMTDETIRIWNCF